MNEEVEIKVILKNPKEVEEKLRKICKFVKEKNQFDEYFTPKHKDFFKENPVLEYLRVRHEAGKNTMEYMFCHFDKDGWLKKTDEYELKVDDPKMASIILKKLDMVHKVDVTKNRKCFDYNDFEISIDFIKELGYFIEVEAKKIFSSLEDTKKRCYEVLNEIGADWEQNKNMGYPLMILDKKNNENCRSELTAI
jgi:predicted adenylyl cyclase CyaB